MENRRQTVNLVSAGGTRRAERRTKTPEHGKENDEENNKDAETKAQEKKGNTKQENMNAERARKQQKKTKKGRMN